MGVEVYARHIGTNDTPKVNVMEFQQRGNRDIVEENRRSEKTLDPCWNASISNLPKKVGLLRVGGWWWFKCVKSKTKRERINSTTFA